MSVISTPTATYAPMLSWLQAAGNRILHISCGDGATIISEGIKNGVKNSGLTFFDATKQAFTNVPNKGGLNIFSNFLKAFGNIKNTFAKTDGGTWTKFKAAGGKAGPVLNLLLMLGFEVPNIWRSFTHKDGGIITGTVETGKTALKLAAGMSGFAIGSAASGLVGAKVGGLIGTAICPGVGSFIGGAIGFIGGIIGSTIASKITNFFLGNSFSEKIAAKDKAKQEMFAQAQMAQQMSAQTNPFAANPMAGYRNYKDLSKIYKEYMQMQQALSQNRYGYPQFAYTA